jgi:phospholipase/carboxylesterase
MLEDARYGSVRDPKQIVIFLHGLGANNQDLLSLAPEIFPFMPDTLFASVNAPHPYEFSSLGYQWFSLRDWSEDRIFGEIRNSGDILKEYLDKLLLEFSLSYENIFLIGFSQGAMMALHTGLRLESEIGGIIALSGRLIKPELLSSEIKSYPKVMLSHGRDDQIVPYSFMKEAQIELESLGVKVEACTSLCGHSIDGPCLARIIKFLQKLI